MHRPSFLLFFFSSNHLCLLSFIVAAPEGRSKTGEGTPPPVDAEVKGAVKDAAGQADGSGVHAAGTEPGMAPTDAKAEPKVKTEKECMEPPIANPPLNRVV